MFKSVDDLPVTTREQIRGGVGRAGFQEMLVTGDMAGVSFCSRLTLEPGSSIGEHSHHGSEELYLVLSGSGVGSLDGQRAAVSAGSFWVVRDGHSHGLECSAEAPLELLALLTETGSAEGPRAGEKK